VNDGDVTDAESKMIPDTG